MLSRPIPITEVYSTIVDDDGSRLEVEMDVYAPQKPPELAGAVVFWHGGALTNYSKTQLPDWLLNAALDRHAYFISVNYRLLAPSSLHDMITDIQALFRHLSTHAPYLDPKKMVLAGSSAGALLASLAVMHVDIPFKGYISLMGLGGQHCRPEHFVNHPRSFYFDCVDFDYDLLTPANEEEYFASFRPDLCWSLKPIQEWMPGALWKGHPSRLYQARHPRAFLMRAWQARHNSIKGTSELLDVLLGRCVTLDTLTEADKSCFPMLANDAQLKKWPRALFLHGTEDQIVLPEDSQALCDLIAASHPESARHTQLVFIPGGVHDGDNPSIKWRGAIKQTEAWLDEVWHID